MHRPILLELIIDVPFSPFFIVMENCGKTCPILLKIQSNYAIAQRALFYMKSRRIQSMVPINGAFCHSTDLWPSGYTTRQSLPLYKADGAERMHQSLHLLTQSALKKALGAKQGLLTSIKAIKGGTSPIINYYYVGNYTELFM